MNKKKNTYLEINIKSEQNRFIIIDLFFYGKYKYFVFRYDKKGQFKSKIFEF